MEQQAQTSTLKFVCPVVTRMGKLASPPFFYPAHHPKLAAASFASQLELKSNLSCIQNQLPLVLFDIFYLCVCVFFSNSSWSDKEIYFLHSKLWLNYSLTGLLPDVYHAHQRKVTTDQRTLPSPNAGDRTCGRCILEWGRLWGKVHLRCERSSSGERVRKHQQDTSWAILTQKPHPPALSQNFRGINWLRVFGFIACKQSINERMLTPLRHTNILPSTYPSSNRNLAWHTVV